MPIKHSLPSAWGAKWVQQKTGCALHSPILDVQRQTVTILFQLWGSIDQRHLFKSSCGKSLIKRTSEFPIAFPSKNKMHKLGTWHFFFFLNQLVFWCLNWSENHLPFIFIFSGWGKEKAEDMIFWEKNKQQRLNLGLCIPLAMPKQAIRLLHKGN